MKTKKLLLLYLAGILFSGLFCHCKKIAPAQPDRYQYLVFPLSDDLFKNSLPANTMDEYLANAVRTLIARIGTVGNGQRKLAFMVSIPSWDTTQYDMAVRVVTAAVKAALETDAAVYFFVPSTTGWSSRPEFWNYSDPSGLGYDPMNKNNIEWSDWRGTPYPHEYRDWGTPEELPPTMCYSCPVIRSEIGRILSTKVAPILVGAMRQLSARGKGDLFAGVTMGDEQMLYNYAYVDDVDTALGAFMTQRSAEKIPIGFNALTHEGFSANQPPADFAGALARVNHDFVEWCCLQLNNAGIPADKIYTHIAAAAGYAGSVSLQLSNAPLSTGFNPYATPGFTTYISGDPDNLTLIYAALAQQHVTHWGSTEANPALAAGVSPADYLHMHFDHGASVMVLNIGATSADLSSRLYAGVYGSDAVAIYNSFLSNR
jgi:hypothetical protein